MKSLYKLLFLVVVAFGFNSCVEDKPLEPSPKLKLAYSEPTQTYVGAKASLKGLAFGYPDDSSFVVFNDSIKLESKKCISWTPAKIDFIAPEIIGDVKIKLIIKSDTSETIILKINLLPDIQTVEIPAGKTLMGSDKGFMDEKPVAEISISKPFIIFAKEVDKRLYSRVTGIKFSDDSLDLPMVYLTWNQAVEFCNALSKLQGYKPYYKISGDTVRIDTSSFGWRLPTEAEWEYACKGPNPAAFDWNSIAWSAENSGGMPHIPGLKSPNVFGLYDMLGNVWEWCWDYYSDSYYQNRPNKDPQGPVTGLRRVARGGSFEDGKVYVRPENRIINSNNPCVGVRPIRNK